MRRVVAAVAAAALVPCLLILMPPADCAEEVAAAVPAQAQSQAMTETLKRAHDIRTSDEAAFVAALQSVATVFPEAPVATERGNATPVTRQFNAHDQHVDGVRVRVPEGQPRDMIWCLFTPPDIPIRWSIAPVTGKKSGGYRDHHRLVDFTPDPNAGITQVRRRRVVFQFLAAENLKPGAEYILWFDFDEPGTCESEMSIACLPAGQVENTLLAIAAALGEQRIADALTRSATSGRERDWCNANKNQDFNKALSKSEAALAKSPEDPNVVRLHHYILRELKRWNDAEEFGAKTAIPVAEKSGDKELLFWVLWNQVMVVWEDDHAIPDPERPKTLLQYNCTELAERTLALAEELNNDNLRFRAYFLQAIWVEGFLGGHHWNKAMGFYKKAMAVAQANGWSDRVSDAMGGVAEVLACIGKLDESEQWSKMAGRGPHPYIAVRRKEWQPTYERNRPLVDRYEKMTLREPNERLQREVIGWNERGAYDYTVMACMNLGKTDEAIETAERLQNRTVGMILGAKIEESKVASLATRKESQSQIKARVDALTSQLALAQQKSDAAAESVQRDLKVQAAALRQLNADIAADELEITDAKVPPRMTLHEMQALVPSDAAMLLYFVSWSPFMKEGFIAVVTDNDCKFYPREGLVIGTYENQGLQPIIAPYIKAVQTPAPGPDPASLRKANDVLYELLLKPIADDIKTRKHLVIIPGGPLVQVPIHLLRDPAGKLLLEEHSISYVPSVGVLKYALARNRKVGGEVAVVANPALAMQGASLKFAETEAQAIGAVYPKANVLLGDRATETAVKSALTTADVLHFACHGLLDVEYPMKSALALTPDDQNDGLLTAREICDYPVKAGLVVLSACESGAGGMSAGWIELVGMSRAWLLAGAPSVMVSLWKLDDRSTSELMGEFYKNLKTMGRAEALQRAQMAMMKRYDNPYYWGAFVLYGDYR